MFPFQAAASFRTTVRDLSSTSTLFDIAFSLRIFVLLVYKKLLLWLVMFIKWFGTFICN